MLPAPPHTDEHGVAAWVGDDASDAADVLHRLVEENELHGDHTFIVLSEITLKHYVKFLHPFNGKVPEKEEKRN